jgi:hypothetical protein
LRLAFDHGEEKNQLPQRSGESTSDGFRNFTWPIIHAAQIICPNNSRPATRAAGGGLGSCAHECESCLQTDQLGNAPEEGNMAKVGAECVISHQHGHLHENPAGLATSAKDHQC